ncbi:MAG: hypothetical protein R3E68_15770 [Burkholderiaceae bacterium]
MSQTFYRREMWREPGASSLEDYLVTYWETNSRAATRPTCWPRCTPGSMATSAPTCRMKVIWRAR